MSIEYNRTICDMRTVACLIPMILSACSQSSSPSREKEPVITLPSVESIKYAEISFYDFDVNKTRRLKVTDRKTLSRLLECFSDGKIHNVTTEITQEADIGLFVEDSEPIYVGLFEGIYLLSQGKIKGHYWSYKSERYDTFFQEYADSMEEIPVVWHNEPVEP